MNAQQESVVLQHYGPAGSASPDWLRACREIEAAEDFAVPLLIFFFFFFFFLFSYSFPGRAPPCPAGGRMNDNLEAVGAYVAAILTLVMLGCAVMAVLTILGFVR